MDRLSPTMHEFLNAENVEMLYSKKIFTVLDFLRTNSRTIEKISKLSFKDVLVLRNFFLKKFGPKPKNSFEKYQIIPSECALIETGIKTVDTLLGGGLLTGNIYEVCGLPGSGKTYFCLTLLKNTISKLSDKIYYLDTKHDFSAITLKRMISYLNKEDLAEALKKVLITRIYTRGELFSSLHNIQEEVKNGVKVKLIVLDSLPVLYLQSSDLTENNGFLNYLSNTLNYLAKEFNIVIIITNLVTRWNEGDFKNINVLKERISCGTYWYNIPHVRLQIKKNGDKASVSLLKNFRITSCIESCDVNFTDVGFV